jgi:hypothetical protein
MPSRMPSANLAKASVDMDFIEAIFRDACLLPALQGTRVVTRARFTCCEALASIAGAHCSYDAVMMSVMIVN